MINFKEDINIHEIEVEGLKEKILDMFFPVGTIYTSHDAAFNPNTAWGGSGR